MQFGTFPLFYPCSLIAFRVALSKVKCMTNGAPSIHTTEGKLNELRRRMAEAYAPVGQDNIDKVHEVGRKTARERILALLDEGSFVETDALAKSRSHAYELAAFKPVGDGVVTGYGTVDGRSVCAFSADATVMNGTFGEVTGEKIGKIIDLAIKTGRPLVTILDGDGARLQEGVNSLAHYGEIFRRLVQASGLIPQISIVLGECSGGNAFISALQDFVIMVKGQSHLLFGTPAKIAERAGDLSVEELGGAETQVAETGICHYAATDEEDAITYAKELLAFLPSNNRAEAPKTPAEKIQGAPGSHPFPRDLELDSIIPDSDSATYDMRDIVSRIVDENSFLEVQSGRADNILTGFARVEGRSVGVVANQPQVKAGALDKAASEKAARFVRTCDAFNVPVITFVDVPGFLPSVDEELAGSVRSCAKLFYAYAESTVGKVTVVVRKAFGEAYNAMGSKHLGVDINLAWPTAQIAIDDADNAVSVLYRKELAEAQEKGEDVTALAQQFAAQYSEHVVNPYIAAERGFVDSVIAPSHTRDEIAIALRLLERKVVPAYPKRHGNIPL